MCAPIVPRNSLRQGSVVTVMGWGSERDTELSTLGIVVTYPIIFIDEVKH